MNLRIDEITNYMIYHGYKLVLDGLYLIIPLMGNRVNYDDTAITLRF